MSGQSVYTVDPALDERELLDLLRDEYAAGPAPLRFVPVGRDSWAFRWGDLWVSVRRDLFHHHPAAYELAAELRERGHEFVLAPVRGRSGRLVHRVGELPVVVFPYVESRPLDAGPVRPADVDELLRTLGTLHAVEAATPLAADDFGPALADRVEAALDRAPATPCSAGPYRDPAARALEVAGPSIRRACAELRELGPACARAGRLVLTHGEPRAANALRPAAGGGLLLCDWGKARLAPEERDWFQVSATLGVPCRGSARLARYYELRWQLVEILEYATYLTAPHAGSADDREMWRQLLGVLRDVRATAD